MKRPSVSRPVLAGGVLCLGVLLCAFDHGTDLPVSETPGQGKAARVTPRFDPEAEIRSVASCDDPLKADAKRRRLAARWIAADPDGAFAFALSLETGMSRDALLRELLAAWAVHDAGAALCWTDAIEDPAIRRSMRSTVCLAVVESDPRRALVLALAHRADEEESDGLLECLAMQWSEREPAAAMEWVMAQPAGEWRDRLMARVAFVLSKSDPHAAASHVAERMESGSVQTEAILSVLHQWAAFDPAAAAEWVEGFPAGSLRDRALGELRSVGMRSTRRGQDVHDP